jgi:hypothetical protein
MQLPEPSTSTVICGSLTTKSAESCACILSFKNDLDNQTYWFSIILQAKDMLLMSGLGISQILSQEAP